MKRGIEIKHVDAKRHVRMLLEELSDRLEDKLRHFPKDAVSLHVLFEENGSRKLYHTSVTCHLPHHTVAADQEAREAGVSIRKTFAEIQRQLEKQKANVRHERLVRRLRRASPKMAPDTD